MNDQFMYAEWAETRIIISHNPNGQGNQERFKWTEAMEVRISDDFFNTSKLLVEGGNKYLITPYFIFVA